MTLNRIFLILALVFAALPAAAHPHVFAKYRVAITQKDKETLHLHFIFTVHNVIAPNPLIPDQRPVPSNVFDALAQHPLLIFLDVNRQVLSQRAIALIRAGGSESDPVFIFDMDVPAQSSNFGFSIYDPGYYDFVSLDEGDAINVKTSAIACSTSYEEVGKTLGYRIGPW